MKLRFSATGPRRFKGISGLRVDDVPALELVFPRLEGGFSLLASSCCGLDDSTQFLFKCEDSSAGIEDIAGISGLRVDDAPSLDADDVEIKPDSFEINSDTLGRSCGFWLKQS